MPYCDTSKRHILKGSLLLMDNNNKNYSWDACLFLFFCFFCFFYPTEKPVSVSEPSSGSCLPVAPTAPTYPPSPCHETQADLARSPTLHPRSPYNISPKSHFPLAHRRSLVPSLGEVLNPPSSHLSCLDTKPKQVLLFQLIKGRKLAEGGGLI